VAPNTPAELVPALTVTDCEPPFAAKFTTNGLTTNGEAGATHVTTAAIVLGLVKPIVAEGDGEPTETVGSVTAPPSGTLDVTATKLPAGQLSVQVCATFVPPRFSLHVKVCVVAAAPNVQVPVSGPPVVDAALPTAETDCTNPANAPVGAVQVVVVVEAAPEPLPAVPIVAAIEKLPVEPTAPPPVAAIVLPAAGAYANWGAAEPTGQTKGQLRETAAAAPRFSSHVNVALSDAAPEVQVSAMFCAVVVAPTKLKLTADAPEKLAASAPVSPQLFTVVVAPAPVLSPPEGVTLMLPVPVEPTVVTPVKFTVLPVFGAYVSTGGSVACGQLSVQVCATLVPPRFSLHVKVCVVAAAPNVQVPVSGPPVVDAALPTAETDCANPANAPVGAVQVVVVVEAAPEPLPAVPIVAAIEKLPVEPNAPPPVAAIVLPAAGVYANWGGAPATASPMVRLSTVGQTGLAVWTAEIVSEVIEPSDTKPRKLLVVAPTIVCVVVPPPSVAAIVTSPARKAPAILEAKKLPPMPRTAAGSALIVIVSVAVFVDSHGFAVVPAPKKSPGTAAVYVYAPALRLIGEGVVVTMLKPV
jgi:hypothetical protein